ncbi:S8 family serine peptidase [Streptomyces sp. V4-01]|uniref:S8 family serine peptidase n=1 Tax=Actinacidiphila polyblastidii TaxID=3110430 RepID=A0ABU7PNW5_9ACTN|nr:S8 family serine peptidase [Streptomyces sp. V4-01]
MTAFPDAPRLTWKLSDLSETDLTVRTAWSGGVDRLWRTGTARGAGVRVCVLDSGVEPDHPEVGPLDGAFAVDTGPGGEPRIVKDVLGDTCGHGTACAGIIRQLAPDCELVSVRVLGGDFSGTGDALLAGLRWAVRERFDVINISLSTTRQAFAQGLRQLADEAYFGGTLLVAAAHNSRVESFPWRFSSVISVGSHGEADPLHLLYNPTPPVEFFARGIDVPAPWLGGTNRRCTGNSFATPHVAGLCALLHSSHRGLTPFQVKSLLHLGAANVSATPDSAPESAVPGRPDDRNGIR